MVPPCERPLELPKLVALVSSVSVAFASIGAVPFESADNRFTAIVVSPCGSSVPSCRVAPAPSSLDRFSVGGLEMLGIDFERIWICRRNEIVMKLRELVRC